MMEAAVVSSEHVIVVPLAVRLILFPSSPKGVRKLVYVVHSEELLETVP